MGSIIASTLVGGEQVPTVGRWAQSLRGPVGEGVGQASGGRVTSSRLALAEGCFPGCQLPATWVPAAGGLHGRASGGERRPEGQVSRNEGTNGTGCGLCSLS